MAGLFSRQKELGQFLTVLRYMFLQFAYISQTLRKHYIYFKGCKWLEMAKNNLKWLEIVINVKEKRRKTKKEEKN